MISKNEFIQDCKPNDGEVSFGIFIFRFMFRVVSKQKEIEKVKFKFLHANQRVIMPALNLFTCYVVGTI